MAESSYQLRVHHIDPVDVMSRYQVLYRGVYGQDAGRQFGMTSDFAARNTTYPDDFLAATATGSDPAEEAIAAARRHASTEGLQIRYDVGVGEALPYAAASFDAVVCVDVLEHVADLGQVLAEVTRVLRPGGLFLYDTINCNPVARFATITIAEDLLRLLPRGTHDPALFIKPAELRHAMQAAGLVPGSITGLGPRGLNRRLDLTFGPFPLTIILFMGLARKPELPI